MFWGAIQLDAQKMVVNCPDKLNAASYLEILENYEKPHFQDIIFKKLKLLCIYQKIWDIFSRGGGRY